ncbi:hypothetical protein EJB05_14461 [Eragrostis curvula]|uniref:Uncharacterized protein n=1 Tax=Eragrostis curvula TaxID=38414 RepID=A0A5J9VZA1_9POAL|nr:hypothetical protein EJB05_25842 [Eragrostis curvula]TVU40975.1 hypothetical protein EJB05_14461 [Eragrostis curvula]
MPPRSKPAVMSLRTGAWPSPSCRRWVPHGHPSLLNRTPHIWRRRGQGRARPDLMVVAASRLIQVVR